MPSSGSQAVLLQPILVARVRAWAVASGGAVRCGSAYVRVGEPSSSPPPPDDGSESVRLAAGPALQWARVKSASRAIEKCVRCYGQVRTGESC